MLMRTDFTQQVLRQAVDLFFQNYDEQPPVWEGILAHREIDRPVVQSSTMLGMGDLEEVREGESIAYDKPSLGWSNSGRSRSFGRGLAFSKELYDDTQWTNMFFELIRQTAQNYPRTRDRFYARFFNNGALLTGDEVFNASLPGVYDDPTGGFIYDGKSFFADSANAHPTKMSNQKIVNYFGLPLTADNLELVYTKMTTANSTDEQGNRIMIRPDTLVVPPELEMEATRILGAEFMMSTTGTPSIKNVMYKRFKLIVWHHLTSADGWFLMTRKKGITALTRQKPEIDVCYDQETRAYKATVFCRFGGMVAAPRYICGCNIPQTL